jgi:hypothetical protein
MAERFFTKVTNDILQAAEQVANRMEEGLSLVFGSGGAAKGAADTTSRQRHGAADFSTVYQHDGDDADLEEALQGNPLLGIADSVVGGIMDGQVRDVRKDTDVSFRRLIHQPLTLRNSPWIVSVYLVCTGRTRDAHGALSRISFRHHLVRALYHVARRVSTCHVCPEYLRLTPRSRSGAATNHHGDHCADCEELRICESNGGAKLAELLHAKLF